MAGLFLLGENMTLDEFRELVKEFQDEDRKRKNYRMTERMRDIRAELAKVGFDIDEDIGEGMYLCLLEEDS